MGGREGREWKEGGREGRGREGGGRERTMNLLCH